jgi:Antirestriction protein
MRKEYAEEVAARIIEQLQQGTAPWQKPWKPGELRLPYNPSTGKEYRGMNSLWLHMQGYADPRWMTYNQAAKAGAQVRKGSKGTKIVYWKFTEEQKQTDEQGRPVLDENGKQKTVTVQLERPRAFTAVVFNAEQIDGLPPLEAKQTTTEPERSARAEAILSNSGAKIEHVPGDRAYYQPATDKIVLPERSQFHTADGYYATALHELAHWTGHPDRMNRDLAHPFGSEGYAREELRAEIASLMLGERLEIGHDPSHHAAYVGSWIKALQEDPREIFRAAADAEKIASYIMALEQEKQVEQAAERQAGEPALVLHHAPEVSAMAAPAQGRTYLAVPFKEKDEAKALGAKWDKQAKAWYAPEGTDLVQSGLARWRVDAANVVTKPTPKSPEQQFAEALKEAGLQIEGLPIMDGKLHRVPVVGDKSNETSGAYAGHLTGRMPGGYIQNFKTGEIIHWKAEGTVEQVTPEERARLAAEAAQQREQREAERQAQQEQTAAAAAALWADAPAATADNAYCKAKGIDNPGELGLRVVPDAVSPALAAHGIKIAKTAKEAKELREADPNNRVFKAGDLLIPGYDIDGKLWTLQSVNPYFKSFMKGGRKHGLFTVAGAADAQKALDADPASPLVLAEGYATAHTVAQATGKPVIVAFDSGNLDAVARELRERYPSRPMFIAADNDHNATKEIGPDGKPRPNVGLEKAKEAAEKYGAGVVAPQFKDGEKGSDWNDYAANRGQDEMRRHFAEQMAAARVEATITAERLVTLARTREMEARNDPGTSADDRVWAKEQRKAAEMLASATAAVGEVRAKTADGKDTRAPAAVKASVTRSTNAMKDKVKEERQQVLNKPAETVADAEREKQKGVSTTPSKRPAKPRARGVDAGL